MTMTLVQLVKMSSSSDQESSIDSKYLNNNISSGVESSHMKYHPVNYTGQMRIVVAQSTQSKMLKVSRQNQPWPQADTTYILKSQ